MGGSLVIKNHKANYHTKPGLIYENYYTMKKSKLQYVCYE